MTHPQQSALALLFPEIERHTDRFRLRHDPSAQHGFPPHISIIWPFIPPHRITEATMEGLASFAAGIPKRSLTFRSTGTAPTGLYLRPEPREPIIQMIRAAMDRYPEYPPYGIEDFEPNPHVTIAHEKDGQKLDAIVEAFNREIQSAYPMRTRVEKVWLLETQDGRWTRRRSFDLA